MPKLLPITLFTISFWVLMISASLANDSTPEQVISKFHEGLIQSMKSGGELSYPERYSNIEPLVSASFDFETISRIVLGRHWKKLDAVQKAQFIDTFSKLSIATYTAQFNNFSGQSFEYLNDKLMKRGKVLVKTQLVTKERVVSFYYILHPADDDWRIINVIVDGISDLSLKKSDYATIMKNEGFDALVGKLLDRIDQSSIKP